MGFMPGVKLFYTHAGVAVDAALARIRNSAPHGLEVAVVKMAEVELRQPVERVARHGTRVGPRPHMGFLGGVVAPSCLFTGLFLYGVETERLKQINTRVVVEPICRVGQ